MELPFSEAGDTHTLWQQKQWKGQPSLSGPWKAGAVYYKLPTSQWAEWVTPRPDSFSKVWGNLALTLFKNLCLCKCAWKLSEERACPLKTTCFNRKKTVRSIPCVAGQCPWSIHKGGGVRGASWDTLVSGELRLHGVWGWCGWGMLGGRGLGGCPSALPGTECQPECPMGSRTH